jgi:nicotinate-nucleotide adenylyltransferase
LSIERWGILGGLFDPIHYAHLAIAEQVADVLDLTRVVFVPAGLPVHRDPARASGDDRALMTELAVADNPRFLVSRTEIDSAGPGYSVETVARLAAQQPGREWFFILSSEAASYLPEWHDPERLLDLARLAVVPRLGYANLSAEWLDKHFPGRADRFIFVETSRLGHSSSDVRARIEAGHSIRYLVPPDVERYIGEHGLYGKADVRPSA